MAKGEGEIAFVIRKSSISGPFGVVVFDGAHNRMSKYEGLYADVRDRIIEAAPADAIFAKEEQRAVRETEIVPREKW